MLAGGTVGRGGAPSGPAGGKWDAIVCGAAEEQPAIVLRVGRISTLGHKRRALGRAADARRGGRAERNLA